MDIEAPVERPLTIGLVQFSLEGGEAFRFLPDEGRPAGPGTSVGRLHGAWSSKYQREAGDVFLFLLIATPADMTLEEMDGAKAQALAESGKDPAGKGPGILRAMEAWMVGRGHDFALRAIWINERESKP
jgi:hypothetical protein